MNFSNVRCFRAGLFLSRLIIILLLMFPSTLGQVDKSLAIVVSTKYTSGLINYPSLVVIYGDPDIYLPEAIRNANTSNSSDMAEYHRDSPWPSSGPVDVDYSSGALYWSNELNETITAYPRLFRDFSNATYDEYSDAPLSDQVTGLSVDWVSNLLYWSDAGNKRIGVIDTVSFMYWRIVVDTDLSSPQDVVVYPATGCLFWSDAGSTPKIEMLDLTKNNRTVLVSSSMVQSPKTLVIDYASLRLYWLDTAKAEVGSVNMDGSNHTLWHLSLFSQISSFFIYKQYFVFADKSDFAIYFFYESQNIYNMTSQSGPGPDNSTDEDQSMIPNPITPISDIVMYEPTRQPAVTSPCTVNNGGCQQICITVSASTRKCQCAQGLFLGADGVSCSDKPPPPTTTTTVATSRGSMAVGMWTMTTFFAVLASLQIGASATK